jgi:hypothetical protein
VRLSRRQALVLETMASQLHVQTHFLVETVLQSLRADERTQSPAEP